MTIMASRPATVIVSVPRPGSAASCRFRLTVGGAESLDHGQNSKAVNHFLQMGQKNSRDNWDDLPPATSPRLVSRKVCTNPDFVRHTHENSTITQELLKWARDEFDPQQYSSKFSDPEALQIEINKKCTDKLEEEWVKFVSYKKKDEKMHKLCMQASVTARADFSSSRLVTESMKISCSGMYRIV
jgi:hypothetical protein